MKKAIVISMIALLLSGCFSLKTELPQITYYDLDYQKSKEVKCKPSYSIGLAEIQSSFVYDSQSILFRKENNEILPIAGIAWIDLPKNLIKKALIKSLDSQCVGISVAPFGGVRNDYLLKVRIMNFEVIQQGKNETAQIAMFYEISSLKDFKILKSGVIEGKEGVDGSYILAFRASLQKVLEDLVKEVKGLKTT